MRGRGFAIRDDSRGPRCVSFVLLLFLKMRIFFVSSCLRPRCVSLLPTYLRIDACLLSYLLNRDPNFVESFYPPCSSRCFVPSTAIVDSRQSTVDVDTLVPTIATADRDTPSTMPSIDHTPPVSPYGVLTGNLFLYSQGKAAFESPSIDAPHKCILVGGLSDGLMPVPYTGLLESSLPEGCSLVQPVLSSSYTGFGHGSLDRDVAELEDLFRYLHAHHSAESFSIVGHSTGCQDAVAFMAGADEEWRNRVRLVALQAPVSDREGPMTEPLYEERIAIARGLVAEDKGQEMMPREAFWAPITGQRFLDLQQVGGRDDYFSSDYTDEQMQSRLAHMGTHTELQVLVAYSGADEYVPQHVDKRKLTNRMVEAMNHGGTAVAEALYLDTGSHNLAEGVNDARKFVDRVREILQRCCSTSRK